MFVALSWVGENEGGILRQTRDNVGMRQDIKDEPMPFAPMHTIAVSPERYARLKSAAKETGLSIGHLYERTMGVPALLDKLKAEMRGDA